MNVRLAWTCRLLALAWWLAPNDAAGQKPVRGGLRGGPVVVVPGADEQLDPRLETIQRAFRRRLRGELQFVRKVCKPQDEQLERIQQEGEQFVTERVAHFKKLIDTQRRLPEVTVADDLSPDPAFIDNLPHVIHVALSAEQAAKYDDERQRVGQLVRPAAIRYWVAVIDEYLLLTAAQRGALCDAIDARWQELDSSLKGPRRSRPPWAMVIGPRAVGINGVRVTSAIMVYLPAEQFAELLRPPQNDVWLSSRKPRSAVRRLVPTPPKIVPAAGAEEAEDAQDVDPPRRARADAPQPSERVALLQALVGPRVAPADLDVKIDRLQALLRLWLDDVDAAVYLSETQRRKFELASKLELKRYEEHLIALAAEGIAAPANAAAGLPPGAALELTLRAPPTAGAADLSTFRQRLARSLSAPQQLKFRDHERARRRFAREAAWHSTVATLDETLPLTAAEWEELSELFDAELDALGDAPFARSRFAAEVPLDRLKQVLDEDQIEALKDILAGREELGR